MPQPLPEPYFYTHIVAFESDPAEEDLVPEIESRRICAVTKLLTNSNSSDSDLICIRLPATDFTSTLPTAQCSCVIYRSTLRSLLARRNFNPPAQVSDGAKPLYEIKQSATGGFGMFAIDEIKAGSLIYSERALLMIPWAADVNIQGSSDFSDGQKLQALLDVAYMNMDIKNQGAAKALFHYPQDVEIFKLGEYIALLEKASRINHSCSPNCTPPILRIDTLAHEVYATKTIGSGKEIFGCYISPIDNPVAADRNANLDARYGFECNCDLCIDPQASDKNLKLLREKLDDLSKISIEQTKKRYETLKDATKIMESLNLQGLDSYFSEMKYRLEACDILIELPDSTEEEKQEYMEDKAMLENVLAPHFIHMELGNQLTQ